MTRQELLSELVENHNARVPSDARRLPDGELRILLKFLRLRAWTRGTLKAPWCP